MKTFIKPTFLFRLAKAMLRGAMDGILALWIFSFIAAMFAPSFLGVIWMSPAILLLVHLSAGLAAGIGATISFMKDPA